MDNLLIPVSSIASSAAYSARSSWWPLGQVLLL